MHLHPRLPLILGVLAGGAAYMLAPIMDVDRSVSPLLSVLIPLARLYWGGLLASWIFAAPRGRRGAVRLGLLTGALLSLLLVWTGPPQLSLRLAAVPLLYGGAAASLPPQLQRRKLRHGLFGALGGALGGPLLDLLLGEPPLTALGRLPVYALLFGALVWLISTTASLQTGQARHPWPEPPQSAQQ